jgi:hypothetical protein
MEFCKKWQLEAESGSNCGGNNGGSLLKFLNLYMVVYHSQQDYKSFFQKGNN